MKKMQILGLVLILIFSTVATGFASDMHTQDFQIGNDMSENVGISGGFAKIKLRTSEWAEEEVSRAYSKTLIPEQLLSADFTTGVTREQFAAISVKLYECVTGKKADYSMEEFPFSDCNTEKSISAYIAAAYKLGITNGTGEGTFSPFDSISRQQLATMLYRVISKAEKDGVTAKEVPVFEIAFSDSDLISDYATESVLYMAQRGIIKGVTENTFAPEAQATKEQAVIIALRIAENIY